MACDKCNYLGYIITTFLSNNKKNTSVRMCPYCQDITAYSNYIKNKYSTTSTETENKDSECIIYDLSRYFQQEQIKNINNTNIKENQTPAEIIPINKYLKKSTNK